MHFTEVIENQMHLYIGEHMFGIWNIYVPG